MANLSEVGREIDDLLHHIWHFLLQMGRLLVVDPIQELDHFLHVTLGFYHGLTVVVAPLSFVLALATLFYAIKEASQSWLLLARSLPRHGRMPRSMQALAIMVPLAGRAVQLQSLYDAARLRIELELLNPLPTHQFDYALRVSQRSLSQKVRAGFRRWMETRNAAKEINAKLAALVRRDAKARFIDLDDCSRAIENSEIVKYFDALTLSRRSRQPAFLAKVSFRYGFVAPLHLVTGVLARYEDEWGPAIDAYGRSVIREHDTFRYTPTREFQSFIFSCWMIWGPSISICTCPEWRGEVALQYGFGDEDNSLILRCPNPQILRILDEQSRSMVQLKQRTSAGQTSAPAPSPIARRVRVSGTLKWGPALHRDAICAAQHAIWSDDRLVLDITDESADAIRVAGGTEAQVYARYYSAYLWIAFVMCKPLKGDNASYQPYHDEHRWRDLIPFFAHANLASPEAYSFYRDQLAHSALEGLLQVLCDDNKPVLTFACAVDESGCGHDLMYPLPPDMTIRHAIIELVRKRMRHADAKTREALSRLQIGVEAAPLAPFMEGDYSACALPGIINDYFEEIGEKEVRFHELRWSLRSDRRLLGRFYAECLVSEVPDSNARDSFDHIQQNLRLKDTYRYAKQKNNYHVVVALDGDELVGGAIATYLFHPNAGVVEYLVVQPDRRQKGVGRGLLNFTEKLLHDDADKMRRIRGAKATGGREGHETGDGRTALDWLVAELPDPYRTPVLTNQFDPFVRAHIWGQWGYKVLDWRYHQPALDKTRQPVNTLMLMAKPCEISRFRGSSVAPAGPGHSDAAIPLILSGDVADLVRAYVDVSMPDAPKKPAPLDDSRARVAVQLIPVDRYLGWQDGLHVKEILSARDPALEEAVGAYGRILADDARGAALRKAFQPGGLSRLARHRYHLWAMHRSVDDRECIGLASFVTMPSAGFANYLGFVQGAGSPKMLEQLVSNVEEQMVRDRLVDQAESSDPEETEFQSNWNLRLLMKARNLLRGVAYQVVQLVLGLALRIKRQAIRTGIIRLPVAESPRSEWYVECPDDISRDALRGLYKDLRRRGFYELDVAYRRPHAPDGDDGRPCYVPLLYKQLGRTYENEEPSEDEKPWISTARLLRVVGEIYDSFYADVREQDRNAALDELKRSLALKKFISSRQEGAGLGDPPHSVVDDDPQLQPL